MRKLSEIKCPKCKQNKLHSIMEILDGGSMQFEVCGSKISEQGIIESGSPVKLLATCKLCYHEWVLKGVKQITEIEAERFDDFLHSPTRDKYEQARQVQVLRSEIAREFV